MSDDPASPPRLRLVPTAGDRDRPRPNPERLFAALLGSSLQGIVLSRLETGEILEVSDAFVELSGYDRAEIIGRTSTELGLFLSAEGRREAVERIKREGSVRRLETDWRRKTGEIRRVEFSSDLLLDENDSYLVTLVQDVTEARRTREQLVRSRAEAEHANAAKTEFLSRMSHELRTPLNAILGFGQLLELDPLRPQSVDSVKQIVKAGRHLLELVNEVLDIQRIETGRLAISLEPVPIHVVAAEAIELMQPLANDKRVALDCPVCVNGGHVVADLQRLRQVLLNLLSNAIKYSPHGGTVAVGAHDTWNERVRICITDAGPGIAPEQRARLFRPFERLGETDIEGTGLGLVLSKGLVELMGGTIGVDSTPGQGSTFWVELPKAAEPSTDEAPEHDDAQKYGNGSATPRTILHVEDNLSNLALIERLLDRRPHVRVVPAMQGRLALTLAAKRKPDLILLDLHLPDMDGSEVLRRLRADEGTRDIPVVIISADATPGEKERLHAAGARCYLTKPLDVRRFLELLDELWATDPEPHSR